MGKGDKKTKKGKIVIGSYGVSRPKSKNKSSTLEVKPKAKKKVAAKKAPAKKKPEAKKKEA